MYACEHVSELSEHLLRTLACTMLIGIIANFPPKEEHVSRGGNRGTCNTSQFHPQQEHGATWHVADKP